MDNWQIHVQPNCEYNKSHLFQLDLWEKVSTNKIGPQLILTSHPACFTMGKGLQKKSSQELIETNLKELIDLPYPIFQIFRGGGLTFHHPNQFIIYAIKKLHPDGWNLDQHLNFLMDISNRLIENFYEFSLEKKLDPLGMWFKDKKIASIGVGIKKMTTTHGIAININDHPIIQFIRDYYPCGLEGKVYSSLDKITDLNIDWLKFESKFLQLLRST